MAPLAIFAFALATPALLGHAEAIVAFRVSPSAEVRVDPLARTVVVRGDVTAEPGGLCPSVTRSGGTTVFKCTTSRLAARIDRSGSRSLLVIEQLRGAPILAGDATLPVFPYDPEAFGLGGACPGNTPSSRGECAIQRGDWDMVRAELEPLLKAGPNSHAALRLGDVAAALGDIEGAVGFWDQLAPAGPFARLAAARLCELLGTCFEAKAAGFTWNPLDPGGLPTALQEELTLRRARALAFNGDTGGAVTLLLDENAGCARAPLLCRRIVLEDMRSSAPGARPEAIALAASLGDATIVGDAELAHAVANEAARAGAPLFGARILSTLANIVATPREQEKALIRAAELYVDAGDVAHAAVVVRFATHSLKARAEQRRWDDLSKRLATSVGATAE